MNRIALVGASAGGLATAEALRRAGHRGGITLVGDEPHLPYDRPPLSKQFLKGEWELDRLALRPRADIDELDLDLRLGVRATRLDAAARTISLSDGTRLSYEALVVATGVRARPLPGTDGVAGVHTLRTRADAVALKARLRAGRRLVIVGAGFLGAEVAAVARGLGVEVTLLEADPVPMAQAVGEQAGRFLSRLHSYHGVRLLTGVTVAEVISVGGEAVGVELADGRVLPSDDVLVTIGSVPNTEWLADSGLTLGGGLMCDQYSAAAPGVYGVGDVACWHNPLFDTAMRVEHRTNAGEQALTVAHNLLNPHAPRPFAPVPYFWSDQYDTRIQAYGYLRDHDEALVLDSDVTGRRLLVAYRRGDRLTGVLAVGKAPKALRAYRALIASGTTWDTATTAMTTASPTL
ncbi:NAD(P)/FAD-dependent oxidoreductase [Streptomyces sp. NBC_00576]|uniref:NAD(P)/FAD-dependent oxidoreductase n=1 Tax=Streptomyces sp. NBC_00576 TaxID=2903665 RepID=UPI002E805E9A|nr:FAD-dependent oxidoreductase [Streptomyces sp. NBC_00576]WUB69369.1 FAD-dependent oxidoreductase [Streptomyces sp. NBC_00576]